eukprot:9758-Eustigmatos_ZCMA.PRE.1
MDRCARRAAALQHRRRQQRLGADRQARRTGEHSKGPSDGTPRRSPSRRRKLHRLPARQGP